MNFLDLMRDHVRAIHRAVAGADLPERPASPEAPPSMDALIARFAELVWMARSIPALAERLPPFAFAPPYDVIDSERELVVEVGVPGVEREDVQVEVQGQVLVVSGSVSEPVGDGRVWRHAELPRGPFSRVVGLPTPVTDGARVEVAHGVIRIRLTKLAKTPPAKA